MSIRRDDAGQMYTIEAVLAVSMMIAALYIVMATTPVDITPRQDFAEVQLKHYGRDVLTLLSYRDADIVVGLLEYRLYREHSPRPPPGKWAHDVNVTDIRTADGKNWTTRYLYINHDRAGENLTTRFKLWDTRDNRWKNPADIIGGRLSVVEYFGVDGGAVRDSPNNIFTFRHRVGITNYTINMVWFEDGRGGVSTPVLVWVDKKPEGRDGSFNITKPKLTGEQELLQYVVIGRGGTIETMLRERVRPDRWDELDIRGRDIYTRENIPRHGEIIRTGAFVMKLIGNNTLELKFHDTARGGYAIWAIDSDPHREVHSHPIFVCVGRPGLAPGAELSPLEAALRGFINLTKLNNILRSYIPENVEYNLHFSNSTGEIVQMRIINGIPAPGAITVTVPVFVTAEVYMARLVLWYK